VTTVPVIVVDKVIWEMSVVVNEGDPVVLDKHTDGGMLWALNLAVYGDDRRRVVHSHGILCAPALAGASADGIIRTVSVAGNVGPPRRTPKGTTQ